MNGGSNSDAMSLVQPHRMRHTIIIGAGQKYRVDPAKRARRLSQGAVIAAQGEGIFYRDSLRLRDPALDVLEKAV